MKGIRTLVVFALCALGSLGFAAMAAAATYNVNDTRDLAQSSTAASGTCVSTAQTCTVRAAVQAANENGGANTINLPAGTYPIASATSPSTPSCGTDLSTGEFKVNPCNNSTQITVVGAGAGTTVINAQGQDRIFDVFQNGALDVQKMTLENGAPGGSSQVPHFGGAIYSQGHLSAEAVTFTGNSTFGMGGGGAVAAADYPGSTASITGSVFQNNTAFNGGAVWTSAPNDVTIAFTLLQANSSTGSSGGGAIDGSISAAGLTLNFDDLAQNVADPFGGGVAWYGSGALNITNSLFNQNQTTGGQGGALFNGSSTTNISIANSSFDGNVTYYSGGAISDGICAQACNSSTTYVAGSNSLNLTQDKFSNNMAELDYGGGLELMGTASTLTSDEFDGNSATSTSGYYGAGYGGAVDWENGPLTVVGSSFITNSSIFGGALDADSGALLTMVDSTLSRNTATSAGGGIFNYLTAQNTPATFTNDSIAFNNAPAGSGGGIEHPQFFTSNGTAGGGFGVENTTIAENSGGDCSSKFTKTADVGNNNDSDQSCFGGVGGQNDTTGVNPLLSDPANNGGPAAGGPGDTETLQTDAEQASSPTVDAGNNNGCPAVDERGVKRPQGKACDIGAYEFGASLITSTSTATTAVTSTSTSRSTVTSTTSTRKPTSKPCPKGKHKSRGKCVKNKKPKKHHKRKHHKKRKKR